MDRFFQYPDSAFGEIDLHDTAAEEFDTQNSIYRLLTTVTNRTEIDRQDRFWKDDAAGCRLQIVDAISKTLPIRALYLLRISEVYAALAGFGWTLSASELWVAAQRAMPGWAPGRMNATVITVSQGLWLLAG